MLNHIAESLQQQIEERSKISAFEFKNTFAIGENLKIGVYGSGCVFLFDVIQLIKKIKEQEDVNQRERQRIFSRISHEHIYNVRVITGNGSLENRVLISEGGLYELIMLLESEEADKIRNTFARIIEQYRQQTGYSVEYFLQGCYLGEIINTEDDFDARIVLVEPYKEMYQDIPHRELWLYNRREFYTVDGNIIFDDKKSTDYLYNNINKAELNIKFDALLNAKSVMEVLSPILKEDMLVILEELKSYKDLEIISSHGIEYFPAQQLFNFIYERGYSRNLEKSKEIFAHIVSGVCFCTFNNDNKDSVYHIVQSVTEFKDIDRNTPINNISKQKDLVNAFRKLN